MTNGPKFEPREQINRALKPGGVSSGVDKVPCALGQEIFLRPRQQKLQSLKWKIGAKVWKKQKQNIYCSYFVPFYGYLSAFGAKHELDKVVIVGGSNNAGVWARIPQPPGANG